VIQVIKELICWINIWRCCNSEMILTNSREWFRFELKLNDSSFLDIALRVMNFRLQFYFADIGWVSSASFLVSCLKINVLAFEI